LAGNPWHSGELVNIDPNQKVDVLEKNRNFFLKTDEQFIKNTNFDLLTHGDIDLSS
jgi:hypothetical protein